MNRKTILSIAVLAVALGLGAVVYLRNSRHKPDHAGQPHAVVQTYLCPMHPQIVQDHPGKCPICAMDLQPTPPGKQGPSGQ